MNLSVRTKRRATQIIQAIDQSYTLSEIPCESLEKKAVHQISFAANHHAQSINLDLHVSVVTSKLNQ
jgi:hypothetical protein